MHIERRCDCELPRQSCRLGRACAYFLTQVMFWFCLKLPRKGSAKGGGICDARVEVNPVNWLTPEARDTETQPHFCPLSWQRFLYYLPLGVANQGQIFAWHLVSCCRAGA